MPSEVISFSLAVVLFPRSIFLLSKRKKQDPSVSVYFPISNAVPSGNAMVSVMAFYIRVSCRWHANTSTHGADSSKIMTASAMIAV